MTKMEYNKAKRIAKDIIDAVSEDKKIDRCDEVADYLRNNPYGKKLIDDLSSAEFPGEVLEELSRRDKAQLVLKLQNELETIKRKRKISRVRKLAVAASGIAAAVVVAVFLMLPETEPFKSYTITSLGDTTFVKPTLITDKGEVRLLLSDSDETYDPEAVANMYADMPENKDAAGNKVNKIIVPNLHTYNLTLADGSEIMLNAGSTLYFPTEFDDGAREVEIHGEAYFKIARQDKPFIVNTGNGRVKVYGTEFNVYNRNKDNVEIVLVAGCVGFQTETGGEVMLGPDQKLSYSTNSGVEITEVDTKYYLMWQNNMFAFENEPIGKVLEQLASWYDVKINVGKEISKNITFVVSRDTDIDDVMSYLADIANFEITKNGKEEFTIE